MKEWRRYVLKHFRYKNLTYLCRKVKPMILVFSAFYIILLYLFYFSYRFPNEKCLFIECHILKKNIIKVFRISLHD